MKSEHVYICDCQVLAHICSNGAFPATKRPLGHTGDLGICAHIGGYQHVWRPKIQLCWWHLSCAVNDRLKKDKLTTTPYNVYQAQSEFPFISLSFVPLGKADPTEHKGGTGGTCDHTGIVDTTPYDSLNAVTLCIPNPLSLHKPPISNTQPLSVTDNNTTLIHPFKLIPVPDSTATSSSNGEKLTIRLLVRSGKENQRPGMKLETTAHEELDTHGSRTFCPDKQRQPIIDIMERHYCAHPLIPGYSSPTPGSIREWAVKQAYNYCVDHDL